MLLFPGQAVHCHLFMRFFFALPSISFSHPTVNMEIVFVSFCVYTHTCMHISIHVPLCGLLMSVFYTAFSANFCLAPVWIQQAHQGHVTPAVKTSPSSINKHTHILTHPQPVTVSTVNHLSSHTCSLLSASSF